MVGVNGGGVEVTLDVLHAAVVLGLGRGLTINLPGSSAPCIILNFAFLGRGSSSTVLGPRGYAFSLDPNGLVTFVF